MDCEKCRWFVLPSKFSEKGECHFAPPIVYVAMANTPEAYSDTAWPRVHLHSGCSKGEQVLNDLTPALWRNFLNFAKSKKPPFASLLEHGEPLFLSTRLLKIRYSPKSFYGERMSEEDNLNLLSDLASKYFNSPIHAEIVLKESTEEKDK